MDAGWPCTQLHTISDVFVPFRAAEGGPGHQQHRGPAGGGGRAGLLACGPSLTGLGVGGRPSLRQFSAAVPLTLDSPSIICSSPYLQEMV